jgi:periplasmic protein TonB
MIKTISLLLFPLLIFITFTGFHSGDENYLAFATEMPQPIGGMAGLHKNIVYPDAARQLKTEGKVFLMAYINEQGNVEDVKILKGINDILDQAAIEGVKKTQFTPGKNNNIPVKVKLALTITFKL